MAASLLPLRVTEQARVAYSSLGPEDRRLIDAWYIHLRNWHNDDFIRSRSRRLKPNEELYAFRTSNDDLVIAFRVAPDGVTVESIFSGEWLRAFEAGLERSPA